VASTRDAYVLIEHLTIYNSATRVAFIKNNTNSIFRDIIIANSRQSGHGRDDDLFDVQATGSVSSHIDTFHVKPVPMKSAKGGSVIESTIYGFDPMFADPANGDFTLMEGSPALGKAHDGTALGDLRWAEKTTAVAEHEEAALPSDFVLEQNYPNPFNPSTVISYQLPMQSEVRLSIYNLRGQVVRTLVAEQKSAGRHSVRWDGRDNAGNAVASGVFIVKMTTPQAAVSRKIMLMK